MDREPKQHADDGSFEDYLNALRILEAKYRRGEVPLTSLLYGCNKLQEKLYHHLNPDGQNYDETWKVTATPDGNPYTERLGATEGVSATPEQSLSALLKQIGTYLDRETITEAQRVVRDPNLTDDDFKNMCSGLVQKAVCKLTGI